MAWMALVSSMIWLEKQLLVLLLLLLDCLRLVVGQHLALLVGPVLTDHHEVDRNMASSDTIIVRVGLDQEADPGGKPDVWI